MFIILCVNDYLIRESCIPFFYGLFFIEANVNFLRLVFLIIYIIINFVYYNLNLVSIYNP